MRYFTFIIIQLLAVSVFCDCNLKITPCSSDCIAIGFIKGSDPIQSCTAPVDCQLGQKCGGQSLSACDVIGYQSVQGACVAPTDSQCLNPAKQLCSNSLSVCITQNGFSAPLNANTCVAPENCQAQNSGLCGAGKTYCLNQGFSKSTTSNDCTCDTTKNTVQNNQCIANSKSIGSMLTYSTIVGLIALFI
ncbi:hypothetical protein ABPG74_018578 [Tetrahymena malaccensis]